MVMGLSYVIADGRGGWKVWVQRCKECQLIHGKSECQ